MDDKRERYGTVFVNTGPQEYHGSQTSKQFSELSAYCRETHAVKLKMTRVLRLFAMKTKENHYAMHDMHSIKHSKHSYSSVRSAFHWIHQHDNITLLSRGTTNFSIGGLFLRIFFTGLSSNSKMSSWTPASKSDGMTENWLISFSR